MLAAIVELRSKVCGNLDEKKEKNKTASALLIFFKNVKGLE